MKISCVFSKMQEFGHFPIISSLIDILSVSIWFFHVYFFSIYLRWIFRYRFVRCRFYRHRIFRWRFSQQRQFSEKVGICICSAFNAVFGMGHETYKADLGCGLQTKKSAIFDLYSYTKSVPSVQSRERHSLPPAIKIDIWFHGYFFLW